jgi:hypothetical protein
MSVLWALQRIAGGYLEWSCLGLRSIQCVTVECWRLLATIQTCQARCPGVVCRTNDGSGVRQQGTLWNISVKFSKISGKKRFL